MRRRLFQVAAMVSLVLCVTTVALWLRSYYFRDILSFGLDGGNSHTAQSILGRLHLQSNLSGGRVSSDTFYSADRLSAGAIWNGGMSGYPPRVKWHFGCVWQRFDDYHLYRLPISGGAPGFSTANRLIVVPYAWLTFMLAILPTLSLVRVIRRSRRVPRSICVRCGYDLRATPQRCPECGMVVGDGESRSRAVGEG